VIISYCSRYGADPRYHYSWRAWEGLAPSIVVSTSSRRGYSSVFFSGVQVTIDQRVVAKQEIQEVESAKRASAPYARTIVTRRKTQIRSCGSNLRSRPDPDDTETRGPRGLGKGDVRGVVEVVLGEHLPKPTRREEVALRRGSKLEVAQDTVYISRPERSWIRPWLWCRRRQQRSCWGGIYVHPEEGILHAL
jgi:hypothetical protein